MCLEILSFHFIQIKTIPNISGIWICRSRRIKQLQLIVPNMHVQCNLRERERERERERPKKRAQVKKRLPAVEENSFYADLRGLIGPKYKGSKAVQTWFSRMPFASSPREEKYSRTIVTLWPWVCEYKVEKHPPPSSHSAETCLYRLLTFSAENKTF